MKREKKTNRAIPERERERENTWLKLFRATPYPIVFHIIHWQCINLAVPACTCYPLTLKLCTPNKNKIFYGSDKVSHFCLYYRIQVLNRHVCNKVRWTRHVEHCWRNTDKFIREVLLWAPVHECTSVGWSSKIYIYQLYVDTEYHLVDLPKVMINGDGWWEKLKGIYATSTTWYGFK